MTTRGLTYSISRSRLTREPPTQGPSAYDPNDRRVLLPPHATDYQRAHEHAHRTQQASQTRAWRLHRDLQRTPYLCRLTRLAVEIQAARMAIDTLRRLDRLTTTAATAEARRETAGYWLALICSPAQSAKVLDAIYPTGPNAPKTNAPNNPPEST